jgi:hypothetical protein
MGTLFWAKCALWGGKCLSSFCVCIRYWFCEFTVGRKANRMCIFTTKYCQISNATVFHLPTYLIWDLSVFWSNFRSLYDSQDSVLWWRGQRWLSKGGYGSFNHLRRLLARGSFIEFSRYETIVLWTKTQVVVFWVRKTRRFVCLHQSFWWYTASNFRTTLSEPYVTTSSIYLYCLRVYDY